MLRLQGKDANKIPGRAQYYIVCSREKMILHKHFTTHEQTSTSVPEAKTFSNSRLQFSISCKV